MKRFFGLMLWCACWGQFLYGQTDTSYCVAFYNVENLFYPSDDSLTLDDDFTPNGLYHWSYKKYYRKISNVAKVLIDMGRGWPPAIVGLAEIECEQVLKDLCYRSPLQRFGYRYVHHDSPDRRGVDVALLYRDSLIDVLSEHEIPVVFPFEPATRNRDLLYVCMRFPSGDSLHIIVNHWTSRFGGYAATIPKRNYYADVARSVVDSLLLRDAKSNILLMGDFNDYATDESMIYHLKAGPVDSKTNEYALYNLMYEFIRQNNVGSHKHEDFWGCLDQLIVSPSFWKGESGLRIRDQKSNILMDDFLFVQDEKYGGLKTYRTFLGPRYIGGYSDHLPVFIIVSLQKK